MRARENRQNAEDQRSIVGSIGYIAGNMGYMEGNLSAIDYSYGGATTHYPLWKPPSGYFPRGEAPPPYEEAVAISQAEALSAQCTVTLPSHVQRQTVASVSQQQQQQQVQQQMQQQHLQQQHLQQHTLQLHTQPQQHPHPHSAYTQQLVPVTAAHPSHPHTHQLTAAAAAAAAAQSNQYTQSTTNLINININSGGVTTIATGENHQPPYSLQSEQQLSLEQQQLHQQQHQQLQQQQQQQQQLQATPQSNSICVQTMPTSTPKPSVSSECSYKNCHLNISASVTTAASAASSVSNSMAYAAARRTPRGSQELLQQPQQQYLTVADVEINASASAASYHSLPATGELMATPSHHITHHQQQHHQQQQQLLAAALSTPAMDMMPPLEIATITSAPACNTADSVTQTLPLPLHATLKSQQQQTQTQTQTQPQHGSKTPSSSRRYHRTIPRYFAVADPLQVVNVKPKSSSNSNSSSTEAATTSKINKKPMCQCPIQHVPMSYMGSNANANANAFLSGAGKLFATASSGNNACALSPNTGTRHASTLAYGQRAKSATNLQQQQHSQEMLNTSVGGTRNPCSHEPKIATISKQVGDELQPHQSHVTSGSVSSIIPPPPLQHHEDVSAPPIVLGRVQKRSSSSSNAAERVRSTSSSGRSTSSSAGNSSQVGVDVLSSVYLNRKVDAYLSLTQKQQQHFYNQQHEQQAQQPNDQSNPTLPPKLYKSLTNLKSATTTATAISTATSGSNSNNNNAVATIYTLSKSTNNSVHLRKEQTPTLTLPPASPSASCSEKSSGKINSSTFYPLANNHVTYTLPKHISGKISLNSTINSVVSKVPSVISIPPLENNNEKSSAINKSTTLPKILRVKRDSDKTTTSTTTSTMVTTVTTATSNSGMSVAHCQMPSYPQLTAKVQSSRGGTPSKQLPVCTTSKNCLNPNEHFLPNDTSLDDDYLSECENCKIAQSAKYYLDAELSGGNATSSTPQETMTLQRKSLEETKEEPHDSYYRSSHTLPSNARKHSASKTNNNREAWQFSTIPAASSSDEDVNE